MPRFSLCITIVLYMFHIITEAINLFINPRAHIHLLVYYKRGRKVNSKTIQVSLPLLNEIMTFGNLRGPLTRRVVQFQLILCTK